MRKILNLSTLLCALVIVGAAAQIGVGAKPKPCSEPPPDCFCPLIFDPVVCNGGCTYSNPCFARCAGAHGCKPAPAEPQ
jgi:hypothetical protein